ncbi:unnamed protein product [Nippostrongylus brasiliensis]|uniref:DUF148 domain-containing protein n=1 Tax=Nippostrongylus brasiliensis TaxID=27835 RepID=A0A0N4YEL1_NIPBR|nr:unnamed protein product [Nippostrongylus brasiliensis]
MRYLILLSAMLCFAEPFWIFGSFFGDSSFKYPFLRRASYEAVKAFNDIINNQQLTRAQRDAELERWAAQYNLVDGYRSYKNSTDKATSDRQQAIQKALDDLMKFFGDLHQLENNSVLQVQNLQSTGGVTESFLNRLTPEAASAYARLIENKTQSLTDLKKALEQWASYYGIQTQYSEMLRQTEQENANFKKAIDELLPKLEIFFRSYMAMVSDKTQSIGSLLNKTSALAAQLNEQQERIVRFIFQTAKGPAIRDLAGSRAKGQGGSQGGSSGFPNTNGGFQGQGGPQGGSSGFPGTWGSQGNTGSFPGSQNAGGFPNGGQQVNGGFQGTNGMTFPGVNNGFQGSFGGQSRPAFGSASGRK